MGYNVSSQEEAHLKYMDLIEKQGKKAEILEEDEVKVQQNAPLYGRILENVDDQSQEYQNAFEINSNYPWGHFGLGNVYWN